MESRFAQRLMDINGHLGVEAANKSIDPLTYRILYTCV